MPVAEEGRRTKLNDGKYKKAAQKAWKTMRTEKHEAAGRISKRLDEFITVRKVISIQHPEASQRPENRFGVIIRQFDKTPQDIVCGKFWELRWAYGCPFNCAYCYLRGTTRGYMKPRPVKLEYILKALGEAFSDRQFNDGKPALFNSGELCDSLMFPEIMSKIADKFEEQKSHRLVTLSKFGVENAKFLIQKPRKNTICSWSINAMQVAKVWEARAPDPEQRIKAASIVHKAGYEVRIRIDPIFPVEGWRRYYDDIAYKILSSVQPTRIVLGTPRGLWKTIHYAEKAKVDTSWTRYFDNLETGWGRKLPFELRKEIYEYMLDRLLALGFSRSRVSICKETCELLDAIGVKYSQSTCQCYSH